MTGLIEYANWLGRAYSAETSELPDRWTPDNPSVGHCHVTALLLKDRFGGIILEGQAHPPGSYLIGVTHFWSVIDGMWFDPTRDQFPLDFEISDIRVAERPNRTTREKAQLLLKLANAQAERELATAVAERSLSTSGVHLVGEYGPELVKGW